MVHKVCPLCGHYNPEYVVRCSMCTLSFDLSTPYKTIEWEEAGDTDTKIITVQPAEQIDDTASEDFEREDATPTNVDLINQTRKAMAEHYGLVNGRLGSLQLQGGLMLTHTDSDTSFYIPQDELHEVVIGRSKLLAKYAPTVNLAGLMDDALVSRRHASLRLQGPMLMLVDHHSKNGTFLNEQRLIPEQPRIVRDKDIIRIGFILLEVSYQLG
jgi:FHA domain